MSKTNNNEIHLLEILTLFWKDKILILSITAIFGLIFYFYALSLPQKYEVTAKLLEVDSSKSRSALNQNSAIFGFLGMQQNGSGRIGYLDEIIKSKDFFNYLLDTTNIELILHPKSINSLPGDEAMLLTKLNDSVNKPPKPNEEIYYLHSLFLKHIEYERKNILELTVRHENASAAKFFIEIVVDRLNILLKEIDVKEAEDSIDYLVSVQSETQNISINRALNNLIESNLQTLVLSNIKDRYALEYLDSPHTPLYPSYPNKKLFLYSGILLGLLISLIFSLIRKYYFN